jgi:hypothetical protein
MLVRFLEILKQFEENGISHLKSAFLCFFKKIVVFILKFFALQSSSIELNFLFIAKMARAFFLELLLYCLRSCHRMIVDFIVTFPFFKDLIARKDTRPISLISY